MTCVDVMCKPFAPNFPAYPRTSYSGDSIHCQSLSKMQEPLDLGPPPSTALSLSSLPYPSSSSLTSSLLSSSSRSSVIVPSSSSSSTSSALPSSLVKEEGARDLEPKVAHYMGVNCVLFTYFTGDTSAVVDDHFTRALNQSTAYDNASNMSRSKEHGNKASLRPMSSRDLPPSFWNSSYQPQANQHHFLGQTSHQFHGPHGSSVGVSGSSSSGELNPFHSTYLSPALHSLSNLQADPWAYSFPSSSSGMPYPHRPVPYDLGYTTSSRFSQNYSSFLMQPSAVRSSPFSSMTGHCDTSKSSDHSRSRFSDHRFGADFAAHHGSCTAMDSAAGLQEATKDLYWF
ncbi:transcription cofactor vestigial-like protein 2 isoform X1 [Biomphalaria pfeifferi]|uniref:Transcription cofactor vestigial-like protein 2 isoform X1 n=1 Tax=Biomphalaria pfeifferi TaxID=112525 RepID=A0AAD8BEY3_BIOPF|nr:transcription cofactor vestigial-like protein 2 isoform X1 [Biomphalaria pfeifferi]